MTSIIKWFFMLKVEDQDRVLDTIDKLRTESLERGEPPSKIIDIEF
jgi:hypothetical protein